MFNDSIILHVNGTFEKPILLTSYNNGNEIINADNETAISIYESSFIIKIIA